MKWVYLTVDKDRWWFLMNSVMNLQVAKYPEYKCDYRIIREFGALLHGIR
jgi:hypothetical protein